MKKKQKAKKPKGKEKARKVKKKKRTGISSKLSRYIIPTEGARALHVDLPGKITPTQLELFPALDYEEWRQVLYKVVQVRDGGNWWVGDALNHGERHYGETYVQAASDTGLSEETLMILKHVALRVSPENRLKELSWSHHREIAKFSSEEQSGWLGMALKKGWNVRELKEALRKKGRRAAGKEGGNGNGKEDGAGKVCQCCGASGAPMKVCGACASVAVEAVKTLGINGTLELLKRKPSKPQKAMLTWAFEHVKEPDSFDTKQEDADWHARFEALRKTVGKGKKAERAAA